MCNFHWMPEIFDANLCSPEKMGKNGILLPKYLKKYC